MSKSPKKLEETALWKIYLEKVPEQDSSRRIWVKDVYEEAITYLKHVSDTFPNYTLHDETHVLNVMYAMGALLGNQIKKLSIGEVELLILAASLHDIGMVYDEADRQRAFNDERKCTHFLRASSPELIGTPFTEWPENTRQWYLRKLHPFRLHEILDTGKWKELFGKRPREIVPENNIVAVCQSHGEEPAIIKNNNFLKYLSAYETDPLFCAMLLRLADLLDFDDTRAPQILFKYAAGSEESVKEWRKHMASNGFTYSEVPSKDELIYSAECEEPGEEYSIREFLSWIDDELINCNELQRLCDRQWQREFPFPRSVAKDGIASVGYVSDEFKLTMDQNQILKLLTGENLYESNDIFVRELLQNAVDATLLRGRMDTNFKIEEARIDLWEWSDREGNIWFRIDDQGTGMTLGMLKRYFLKVGNSYYTSKELKRDLHNRGGKRDYFGISRFGIGFLSCFLCGIEAEVSTLYFDDNKSKEDHNIGAGDRDGYGLRMQVTGLAGYYTLRSQADNHIINNSMPAPEFMNSVRNLNLEYNGYRSKAGTSIVIKLDPGRLGTINLKAAAENYICGTRMPVFYNGERIGCTYAEIMKKAHELEGETIYELSNEEKEEFDNTFPGAKGQYPKIAITVVPLDTEEYQVISNFSGILVRYDIYFDNPPQWQVMDQTYRISTYFNESEKTREFIMRAINVKTPSEFYLTIWARLSETYGDKKVAALKEVLKKFTECPASTEELGDAWLPFAEKEDILNVWRSFVDERQNNAMYIKLGNRFPLTMVALTHNTRCQGIACIYQGIFIGFLNYSYYKSNYDMAFFLENEQQPTVDVGRTKVSGLPTETLAMICGIMAHPNFEGFIESALNLPNSTNKIILLEWRHLRDTKLGRWLMKTQNVRFTQIQEFWQTPTKAQRIISKEEDDYNLRFTSFGYWGSKTMYKFAMAYYQDAYDMQVCYENGQTIAFTKKRNTEYDDSFDKFPPMMFCKAGSEESRRYLCCGTSDVRRCITLDHPFAQWLLENAVKVDSYFPRQFQQIVYSLCNSDSQEIIKTVNEFRQQLIHLNVSYGINMSLLHELTKNDFWYPNE